MEQHFNLPNGRPIMFRQHKMTHHIVFLLQPIRTVFGIIHGVTILTILLCIMHVNTVNNKSNAQSTSLRVVFIVNFVYSLIFTM